MAIPQGIGFRNPAKSMTIKALQERQKAAQAALAQSTEVSQPISDPWQAVSHVLGVGAAKFGESRLASQEADARSQLASIMAGIDPEKGATMQQLASMQQLDPDLANKEYERMMAERAAARAREDEQTFRSGESELERNARIEADRLAREQQTTLHEDTQAEGRTTAETLAETQRVKAEQDAAIATAKAQQDAALRTKEGEYNAAVQAGVMTPEERAANIDRDRRAAEAEITAKQPETFRDMTPEERAASGVPEGVLGQVNVKTGEKKVGEPLQPSKTMTPGEIKTDQDAAVAVNEWKMTGGANIATSVAKTKQAIDLLKKGDITGFRQGIVEKYFPEPLAKLYNPDGTIARDSIRDVVQENLRATLGSQFTQQEGESLMARAFDPQLDESENLRRAELLLQQVAQTAINKQSMVDYWDRNRNSLRGYVAPTGAPDVMQTLRDMAEGRSTGGGSTTAPAAPADESDEDFIRRMNETP